MQTNVLHRFLYNRQGFQSQEVHLNEAGIFDDRTFVLGDEHLLARFFVVGGTDGHPVGNVVAANDGTAGMHTCTTHVAFEHLGIFDGIAHQRVGRSFGRLKFGYIFDGIGQVQFLVGNLVGNQFAQAVGLRQRQLLHTCYILDGQLGSHSTVSDDVRYLLLSVFLGHPAEHLAAAVVIEVHIDIGKGDTVRVQETLEQQVVLDGVYLRDSQAVGHRRTGRRTTSRPHGYAELGSGGVDKVLHDKEVTRETHRLHNIEFKHQTLLHFFTQRIAIKTFGTIECQLGQVVGLQLDTIQLLIASQTLDLGVGSFLVKHHFAVLIAGELVEQVLFGIFLAVFLLRTEVFGDGKGGHDRSMINGIKLHFIENLKRICQGFGHIGKKFVHLGLGLHPFLLSVKHAGRVIKVLARTEADETVVCLSVLFVHEMDVVRTNQLDAKLLAVLQQLGVYLLLHGIGLMVSPRHGSLMTLQLQIKVVAKEVLIPADGFLGLLIQVVGNLLGNFTTQAGGADNQPFVILLQFVSIGTRTHIITLRPSMRHQLDKVVVAFLILSQHHQVIAALVGFTFFLVHRTTCYVHLTTDNRFKDTSFRRCNFLPAICQCSFLVLAFLLTTLDVGHLLLQVLDFSFRTTVLLIDVVGEFFDAEHVAMVGHRDASHTVLHSLVHQAADTGLAIQQRILSMYM